jgi:hypothetical protein
VWVFSEGNTNFLYTMKLVPPQYLRSGVLGARSVKVSETFNVKSSIP